MPCSGCGQSGHNIRTCGVGPTPGGVNGMRARAASGYYSHPAPTLGRFLSSFEPVHSTPIRESVPRFGEDIKISEIKHIVDNVQVKVEDQLTAINRRFDKNEQLLKKSNERDADILDQIFNKLEIDSKKTQDSYKKLMNRIDVVKHETLEEIDTRFKSIYDRVVRKTVENKKKILKNEENINEIRSLVVYMIEKDEKKEVQAAKKEEIELKLLLSEDEEQGDSDDELMGPDEMMNLSIEMIKNLKKCRNKKDQFKVITEMALKYVKQEK